MVLLYRLTGEPRYLDFCKYILRAWEQPNGPKIISTLLTAKRVDKVGDGKAYEMLSCLNGALEYYRTVGDRDCLQACLNAWQDIVDHRLYLTGTASYREFFHDDFDLPNVNNVGETCVTVTWLQFNAQLLRLTGEARFAEQLEKVVLNQLFGAQCPDGTAWGYYVQMQGKKPYSSTLDGHCCLSSGPRGVVAHPHLRPEHRRRRRRGQPLRREHRQPRAPRRHGGQPWPRKPNTPATARSASPCRRTPRRPSRSSCAFPPGARTRPCGLTASR